MPELPRIPKLCKRKNGRLYVTDPHLKKQIYLASPEAYEEWRAAFIERIRQCVTSAEPVVVLPGQRVTAARFCEAYLEHARDWYRKDGEPTSEVGVIESMCRRLVAVAGDKMIDRLRVADVEDFLKQCIADGLVRRTINALLRRLKTAARWGVRKEILSGATLGRILSVPAIRRGRTVAREKPKVRPVDLATVEKTLPCLAAVHQAMVRVQLLSGMRPGEICRLRADEIDRGSEPWEYVPASYKTEHMHEDDEGEERRRRIFFGPQARAILKPLLEKCRETNKPLFRGRSGRPISPQTYHSVVESAAKKAGVKHWHPNMLRHTAGTLVREKYDAETARQYLGHEHLRTTELYAEQDLDKARRVAEDIG